MALHSIPKEERPRERFLVSGADALSLTELLAICIGSGRKGKSVLSLAEDLLAHFGTLSALVEASIEELTEVKGIGVAKAVQLKSILALSKRYKQKGGRAKYLVSCPDDVYALIGPEIRDKKREVLALMMRDIKGYVFHHEIISVGTLSQVIVHPREIFHQALYHRAFSLIIAHNHPSGDCSPSTKDIELTKLLFDSGKLLGLRLDDHLVIGRYAYTSLWDQGVIKTSRY